MLWIKAFHLIAVISWMAVLLYLPRLFVNWTEVDDVATRERLALMMRRLLKLGGVAMGLTLVFGVWLLGKWMALVPNYFSQGWLHTKLVLIAILIIFQIYCGRTARRFAAGQTQQSARFYRLINELPALIMIAIVILVVVKPF